MPPDDLQARLDEAERRAIEAEQRATGLAAELDRARTMSGRPTSYLPKLGPAELETLRLMEGVEERQARLEKFLKARLDERAKAAQKALDFEYDIPQDAPWWRAQEFVREGCASTWDAHVALNDPAQVLRDVEAGRRVLLAHSWSSVAARCCITGVESTRDLGKPCRTLRMLALAYADHPGYREEWRL